MRNDNEFAIRMTRKIENIFADVGHRNMTYRLNEAQYKTFTQEKNSLRRERGWFVADRPETTTKVYNWLNKLTTKAEGIYLEDYMRGMNIWMAKFFELHKRNVGET